MSKKLIIAPFKDMSGYATLANAYVKALFSVTSKKEDYILSSVRYDSGSLSKLSSDFIEAHKRPISDEVDTIVQIVTPNEMRPIPGKKNIAVCCWETNKIPVYWAITLNGFDAIIVPCEANKEAFIESGVTVPIYVIGMPAFKEQYSLEGVEPFEIPGTNKDTFIFYNISQWTHKKGIDAVIRSYFLAFQNNENVLLLLKGYIGMKQQQGDAQKIIGAVNDIKGAMRLQKYPKIYVTDAIMNEDGIKKLHKRGNCYVNMSRGEGWGIPAFEAVCYGKKLVTTYHTGMLEWVNHTSPLLVDSIEDSVHNMPHPDPNLYTANECWFEPSVKSGAHAMTIAFTESNNTDNESIFSRFDPLEIGKKLIEVIE
jgi:hypothetical protein